MALNGRLAKVAIFVPKRLSLSMKIFMRAKKGGLTSLVSSVPYSHSLCWRDYGTQYEVPKEEEEEEASSILQFHDL